MGTLTASLLFFFAFFFLTGLLSIWRISIVGTVANLRELEAALAKVEVTIADGDGKQAAAVKEECVNLKEQVRCAGHCGVNCSNELIKKVPKDAAGKKMCAVGCEDYTLTSGANAGKKGKSKLCKKLTVRFVRAVLMPGIQTWLRQQAIPKDEAAVTEIAARFEVEVESIFDHAFDRDHSACAHTQEDGDDWAERNKKPGHSVTCLGQIDVIKRIVHNKIGKNIKLMFR